MGVTEDDPQKGLKDELKHLFSKLCGKLDALCNFHYTPKAAIPEMKVKKPYVSGGQEYSVERMQRFHASKCQVQRLKVQFRWVP